MIAKFHYLTQDVEHYTHQQLVLLACENGIKWIQLRVKNKSFYEFLHIAKEAKAITKKYKVTLIINDNVEIAQQIDADGVHLGKNDTPTQEARAILGNKKIIGATANTFKDIEIAYQNGANYIGLGPYKYTNTKDNLSTILGIEGYQSIIHTCKQNLIPIPIIAIGGITHYDIKTILNTGLSGVAVSSALHHDINFVSNLNAFKRTGSLDI